jgi:hypothetical protein
MAYRCGNDFIPDPRAPNGTWLERYRPPEVQPQVLAAIQTAIRTKSGFELEHRVMRVDGSHGWTFLRAIPRLDGLGEIIEWIGAAADLRDHARQPVPRVNPESG